MRSAEYKSAIINNTKIIENVKYVELLYESIISTLYLPASRTHEKFHTFIELFVSFNFSFRYFCHYRF